MRLWLTFVLCRIDQVWDPTIKAYRAQRLPIALSKSSIIANASKAENAQNRAIRSFNSSSSSSATSPLTNDSSSSRTRYPHSLQRSGPLVPQPFSYTRRKRTNSQAPNRCNHTSLPSEVYNCILEQLRKFHEGFRSLYCQTCYLRDLYSLSLTNRAWDKAVKKRL